MNIMVCYILLIVHIVRIGDKKMSDVKVGQVWRDWDVRFRKETPRYLKVIRFINDLHVQVENTDTKRKTIIAIRRFKPDSNGYRLISEKEQQNIIVKARSIKLSDVLVNAAKEELKKL